MIKGVAFDFDCTLYDRAKVWDRLVVSFNRWFEGRINTSISNDLILEALRQSDTDGIANDDNWQGIFNRIIQKGLFTDVPSFEEFFAFIKAEFPPAIALHSDTVDCLRNLKRMGLKTGIYTNGLSDYGRIKIQSTGIDEYMDYILCSGDIDIEKPDRRGFKVLADGMGLMPEEIAFVGDHPTNDILGAAAAGMTSIWIEALVPWPAGIDAPKHSIKTLSEILALVEVLNGLRRSSK